MSIETREASSEQEQFTAVSLGTRIRDRRESLAMNQKDFADKTGLSQGYLSQVENDEVRNLGYKSVIMIVQTLGAGINFSEGRPDAQVFLWPQARRLHQILFSPDLDDKRRETIEHAVEKLIPETDAPQVRYIEMVPQEKKIGDIVYDVRTKTSAMTQGELAQRSNLSQGYLSQLERGDVENPALHTLRKISKALNIDVYKFLGIQQIVYPRAIENLDRFLRSDRFTAGQKAVILNRLIQIVSLVQPLVNRIDPIPQKLQIK